MKFKAGDRVYILKNTQDTRNPITNEVYKLGDVAYIIRRFKKSDIYLIGPEGFINEAAYSNRIRESHLGSDIYSVINQQFNDDLKELLK